MINNIYIYTGLLLFNVLLFVPMSAQKVSFQLRQPLSQPEVKIYEDHKYKFYLSDKSKDKNIHSSPESIAKSFFLSKNMDSYLKHIYDTTGINLPSQEFFENKKKKKVYSIKLLHRLNYTINGEELSYIKFHYYKDNEIQIGSLVLLKKVKDKWYVVPKIRMTNIANFVSSIKTDKIYSLLKLQKSDDDLLLNQTIESCKYNGCFDFGLFMNKIKEWRKDGDEKKVYYFFDSNLIF